MSQQAYYYKIFGLVFSSTFEIPHLLPSEPTISDVTIREDTFTRPPSWEISELFHANSEVEEIYVNLRGEPYLLVKSGNEIIVNRNIEATTQEREVMILASGVASILIQRNFLLIHGATILHKGSANIFLGPKGIGKSTLSAALLKKGYDVLGDDMCAIYRNIDGNLNILKPPRTLKLTKESIDKLALESGEREHHCDLKYWLELPETEEVSFPLSRIFILKALDQPNIIIESKKGTQALEIILENLYRPSIVDGLKKWEVNFKLSSIIASSLEIAEITRPEQNFEINLLTQKIEEQILN